MLGLVGSCYSPFQVTVHDGEEHLEEEVDGVYQHRQEVQPCFARHCESFLCTRRDAVDGEGLRSRLAV
jgi:hypothetical protein